MHPAWATCLFWSASSKRAVDACEVSRTKRVSHPTLQRRSSLFFNTKISFMNTSCAHLWKANKILRPSCHNISNRAFSALSTSSRTFSTRVTKPTPQCTSPTAASTTTTSIAPISNQTLCRNMATSSSLTQTIQDTIQSHKVVVYSKSYCPYCKATKALFSNLQESPHVLELDQLSNGPALQDALLDMTGQRSVPNVFVNGKHVGGNDDTQAAARSGKLQEWLKQS